MKICNSLVLKVFVQSRYGIVILKYKLLVINIQQVSFDLRNGFGMNNISTNDYYISPNSEDTRVTSAHASSRGEQNYNRRKDIAISYLYVLTK